jgi:hypothetical protein
MDLVQLLVTLIIVAVLLGLFNWVVRQFPEFLNATVIKIINVIIIVVLVLWLVGVLLGGWGSLGHIRIGR